MKIQFDLYQVHKVVFLLSTVTLTFKINRVHPLFMINMSTKFDNDAYNN